MSEDYGKYADPLQHARLRIGRARRRFVQLGKEITEYVNANRPALDRAFDSTTGWTTYRLKARGRPPQKLADGAGAVSEDLRIGLDKLIAALRSDDELKDEPARFPICLSVEDYLGSGYLPGQRQQLLRGLSADDVSLIDSLQPYHRVDPSMDRLARLQALYESYKRGKLTSVLVVSESPSADFEELDAGSVNRAKTWRCQGGGEATDRVEVLSYRVWPDPEARLKVDISLRFDLRFDPVGVAMSELGRIRAQVEKVIHSFDTRLRSVA